MSLSSEVIHALQGRALVTAESLTGGGIGAALTAVPGSSAVYKGGVICYTNWVKENILGVPGDVLEEFGAVSQPVAKAMAEGARKLLKADIAVAVTGLAGPGGDDYGNPVGTVCIGCADESISFAKTFRFEGTREDVRSQTVENALRLVLNQTLNSPLSTPN